MPRRMRGRGPVKRSPYHARRLTAPRKRKRINAFKDAAAATPGRCRGPGGRGKPPGGHPHRGRHGHTVRGLLGGGRHAVPLYCAAIPCTRNDTTAAAEGPAPARLGTNADGAQKPLRQPCIAAARSAAEDGRRSVGQRIRAPGGNRKYASASRPEPRCRASCRCPRPESAGPASRGWPECNRPAPN